MTKDKNKVDLTLLKKLVIELEASLTTAEGVVETDHNGYFVEMSKGAGLAAGVMQEASMLIMDIYGVVQSKQGGVSVKESFFGDLLGKFKGGIGGSN